MYVHVASPMGCTRHLITLHRPMEMSIFDILTCCCCLCLTINMALKASMDDVAGWLLCLCLMLELVRVYVWRCLAGCCIYVWCRSSCTIGLVVDIWCHCHHSCCCCSHRVMHNMKQLMRYWVHSWHMVLSQPISCCCCCRCATWCWKWCALVHTALSLLPLCDVILKMACACSQSLVIVAVMWCDFENGERLHTRPCCCCCHATWCWKWRVFVHKALLLAIVQWNV